MPALWGEDQDEQMAKDLREEIEVERKARERLITAAPDMCAALRIALEAMQDASDEYLGHLSDEDEIDPYSTLGGLLHAIDMARAAIERAGSGPVVGKDG